MKTRAVLFDMGGTLVFATCSESETFRRILRSVGITRTKRDIEGALSKAKKELDAEGFAEEFGKIPRKEFWVRRDSCVLKYLGIGDQRGELARVLDLRWFDFANFKLYSGTQILRGLWRGLERQALRQDSFLTVTRRRSEACSQSGLEDEDV